MLDIELYRVINIPLVLLKLKEKITRVSMFALFQITFYLGTMYI